MTGRGFLAAGAFIGAAAVAAGAFGAHALRSRLTPDRLDIYETAARYQMYHALALLAVGLLAGRAATGFTEMAGWLFLGGTLVFCGTLYLLAFGAPRWVGAITPIGGLCFILGWLSFGVAALRGS